MFAQRYRFHLLFLIFIFSGFAGLVYQAIWSHYLGLFLGHAAYAQALVLALFMGGMAIGAAIVARFGLRWRNLVRGYAAVEGIVGLLGLGFHVIFIAALGFSYDVIMPALGEPWLVNSYKWLLAALLILPQTILLGMTFPLMTGGLIRRLPNQDGRIVGSLYFTNSIGAAVGVLVAAFVLLPAMGLPGAMITAGLINLAVAMLAWSLSREQEIPRPPQATSDIARPGRSRRLLRIVLLATLFSSAASFAYEIMFVRMLSLAVGSTLHAFELMLASFIAGIALGALWIRGRADRIRLPLRVLGLLQILMGLTALLALALYANAFSWVGFLMDALSRTDGGYAVFNLGTAAIAILIMLPTAFFAGTTLPLFTTALLRDGQGEASVGRVYAWNTVGAIVGVFVAVHLMIPFLGLKLAMIVAAMVDIAIGLALIRSMATRKVDYAQLVAGIGVMIAAMWVSVNLVPFDALKLSAGVYRTGQVSLPASDEILFYRDGKTASVSVIFSQNGVVRISTNGKIDASIQSFDNFPPMADEPTMVIAGALPLAYSKVVRNVAVVGFGSGLTTHTVLGDEGVERVDTIEIEAEMVEGAFWFGDRVGRAYDDPRSHIIIDDAKSFFAGQQRRYDAIISEPSNPWISGVGALFSKEFYEFVPRFLSEDGVFLQWLQLYEIDERLVGSVLNAILPAFGDVNAYLANDADLLLVASMRDLVDSPSYSNLLSSGLGDDLRHVGLSGPEQLAFRKVADRDLLEALARIYDTRPNSDFFPILSLEAPRTRFRGQAANMFIDIPALHVPMLEWLGIRSVPPTEITMPPHGHFLADDRANRARTVRKLILGEDAVDLADVSSEITALWFQLKLFDRVCEASLGETSGDWLARQFLELTHWTLAYLDAEGLQGILIDPFWLDCDPMPGGIAAAMDLVKASASRDTEAMIKQGRDWLENLDSRPDYLQRFDGFAFSTYQFGLIGEGRLAEARDAEAAYGRKVPARGQYGMVRSILLAWLHE